MSRAFYYQGGCIPSAPASNMAQQWDDATSTYTAYAPDGTVANTRPFTAAEQAQADADAAHRAVLATRTALVSMAAEQPTLTAQMSADLASVASGWDTLTAAERTAIMGRVIGAFGTVMDAIAGHLIVSRIIPPPPPS